MFKTTMKFWPIVLFCLTVGLTACNNNKRDTPASTLSPTVPAIVEMIPEEAILSFTTIEQNDWGYGESLYGSFENQNPALLVVTRLDDIDLIGNWITPKIKQMLQHINYNENFVLIVFQGWKPSSGYGVQIKRIAIQNSVTNIFADFKDPDQETETHATETSPYHVVQVSKPINWEDAPFNLIVSENILASYRLGILITPSALPYPPPETPGVE